MIIGITGTDGAGKGTVVQYLVDHEHFVHYSARSFIVAEIERQGLSIDRNQMRLTANALRAKYGNEFVVRQAYEAAASAGTEDVIIESIRTLAEAEYLKERDGILVAVDADVHLRFERVQARRSESDKVDFETFVHQEELEKNDPDPHGMQKAKVMEMADYVLTNEGSVEELYVQVEAMLAHIRTH